MVESLSIKDSEIIFRSGIDFIVHCKDITGFERGDMI